MWICMPIYRFFRYARLRRILRHYLLKEQKHLFNLLEPEGKLSGNVQYEIDAFEHFRFQYQLTLGEMGILLREIKWADDDWLGRPYGIITDWMYSLLDYYTDLDALRVILPPELIESAEQLQKQDTRLLPILVERMIQRRLYLYAEH